MKKGNVTIHEIARLLGVDSSTVSRALNDSDRVSLKTKKRILDKASELGYQTNLIAANLRTKKTNTIGVVVPRISRHFFSNAIAGIEEVAFNAGYTVIIAQSLDDFEHEKRVISNLCSNRVDGILISISMETINSSHLEDLEKTGVPLVFFDRFSPKMKNSNKVLINDFGVSYQAVKHLIDSGCKHIAHFSGPQTLEIYKNRFLGYKKALEDSGIPFNENLVFTSRLMDSDGSRAIKVLLSQHKNVDGIFSANDIAAIAAMKHLKQIGVKVPNDIAIVGFSNEPVSQVIEPSLTTIDQSSHKMGKVACRLLLENIRKKQHPPLPKTITINATLIKRNSSNRKIKQQLNFTANEKL